MVKGLLFIFLLFCLAFVIYLYIGNQRIPPLGVLEGRFTPCPNRPNCVSSQAEREWQRVAPFQGNSLVALKKAIETMPRSQIVTSSPTYLRVVFTSPFFRFKDDAEFFLDESKQRIEVRSGARVGYYDFGVNRQRVETIRKIYEH